MSKPSIFSKDYKKKMQKRRRRITLLVIIIVIISGATITYIRYGNKLSDYEIVNKLMDRFKKTEHSDIITTNIINDSENNKKLKSNKQANNNKNKPQDKETNEEIQFKLTDGQQIGVVLKSIDGEKYFDNINDDYNITYDFSPSKKRMVLCSMNNQDMFYVGTDGSVTNITKTKYVSSSKKEFLKDMILKKNSKYIWHKTPKFIDENNIAFVSELPWINDKNINYLWIYNINNKKHTYIKNNSLQGESIILEYSSEDYLNLTVDRKKYKINSKGIIIN